MSSSRQGESSGDAARKQQEAFENTILEAVKKRSNFESSQQHQQQQQQQIYFANTSPTVGAVNVNANAAENANPLATDNTIANAGANVVDNATATANHHPINETLISPLLPTIAPTSPAGATDTNGNNNCLTDSRVART